MIDKIERYVLGVDPGVHKCGLALLHVSASPRLVDYAQVKFEDVTASMAYSEITRGIEGFITIAIEDQYVHKNVKTSLDLARITGRWIEVAEQNMADYKLINPKTWQAAELGGGKMKRYQLKAASKGRARAEYGIRVNDHISDAIYIARYWAVELALTCR